MYSIFINVNSRNLLHNIGIVILIESWIKKHKGISLRASITKVISIFEGC
jgi:hypothetical protein